MIDFSTRGYVRKKNGRFKQSSLQRWRNRKKTFNDYVMPAVAVITVWSTVWLVDILPMAEARAVITIENRQFSKVDAAESSSHGEEDNDTLVSAGVQSEERQGTPVKDVVRLSDDTIEGKIRQAWIGTGEEENAIKVFKCESRYDPNTIGDEALAFWHNGQLYGRSIGIAQIRTGGIEKNGRVWVASDNVEEFEKKMKNVDENLKVARSKYDVSIRANNNGWYPWMNCAVGAGLIH